jgi:hypothetical protein
MIVYPQSQKAERFKQLYESAVIFIVANSRNIAPAKILSLEDCLALAVTSAWLLYSRQLHSDRV